MTPGKMRLLAMELHHLAGQLEQLAQASELGPQHTDGVGEVPRRQILRTVAAKLELYAEHLRPEAPGFMGVKGGGW